MTAPTHTYGPTCLLYDSEIDSAIHHDPDELVPPPPGVRAQFFYYSPFPIDDPLSPLPAPAVPGASQTKLPPRPFSVRDNIALEEAWQGLRSAYEEAKAAEAGDEEENPQDLGDSPNHGTRFRGETEDNQKGRISQPRWMSKGSWEKDDRVGGSGQSGKRVLSTTVPSESRSDILSEPSRSISKRNLGLRESKQAINTTFSADHLPKTPVRKGLSLSPMEDGLKAVGPSTPPLMIQASDDISGSPFIRAPVRERPSSLTKSPFAQTESIKNTPGSLSPPPQATFDFEDSCFKRREASPTRAQSPSPSLPSEIDAGATVTVGASRLHLVELPNLQMKPIYWSPVQDISRVIRATWFYKNTMLPVEPELANRLEEGYNYLKPWTETWQDELRSCLENGAEAELKIVYNLWPTPNGLNVSARESVENTSSILSGGGPREHRWNSLDFAENKAAGCSESQLGSTQLFKNSSVIFVDSKDAQILRPSVLPSVSRGRRPLSSICKGRQIGVAVVRGFNPRIWDKLHPSKFMSTNARNFMKMHQMATDPPTSRRQICYACQMEDMRPNVSDLVLVIHGIGQKLSERVESFHFTHAINSFRRQVNIELSSDTVWPHMRSEQENIMVLPVNWRSTLSLEDTDVGVARPEGLNANRFSLKDITPESIPGIRNLISDVMLDIPYYLSHHKQKMVFAVVKEANRIYRLWCQNNPSFQTKGRVHLIAHSLGSIMAIDILTQQPTKLPHIDFLNSSISETMFEFDTTNLFFCGSPAGFFLLLNKSTLLPRKGRNKPGCNNGEDSARGVAGEAGTYGCLAVNNLYNVMHETDPIAYRLNAAVDSELANLLKDVSIPSSSASIFQSISNIFRWGTKPQTLLPVSNTPSIRPSISKLPSTIEMETHDFTREEIAETRMSLLNDNGHIDFYLSGGGGPLNIQYLNMLMAHSSYWILQDFARFIVVEVGRPQGRDGTLLALRAEKKKGWKRAKS
ncbi:hypothetical protein FQN57_000781 [Myotisia sp. PD_48]|nr:hypothetical protein FQN57_000781 [Myotisia sp. PD_48]